MIRTGFAAIAVCVLPFTCNSQEITRIQGIKGGQENRAAFQQTLSKQTDRSAVVLDYDEVLPHFVDGASSQTSIVLTNLEIVNRTFDLLFFADDGSNLEVDIEGLGPATGVTLSLGPFQTITVRTTGAGEKLLSGWVFLRQTTFSAIGMQAIFRQTVPGRQPQEAAVPAANWALRRFLLPFDNTDPFVTGVALSNVYDAAVTVNAIIRAESGQVLETHSLTLPALGHTAFVLSTVWPITQQVRGSVEFQTLGVPTGVGGVGLRFNGAAFTSTNPFQKPTWTQ